GGESSTPVLTVYCNVTITGPSVAVALISGAVELITLAADKLSIPAGPIGWIASLNLNYVGYVIVGLFVATWVVALGIWRYARIEEKWSTDLRHPDLTG